MNNPQLSSRAFRSLRSSCGRRVLFLGLGLWLVGLPIWAANPNPPSLLSYQGFLVDADGNPLNNDSPQNHRVVFRVYDSQTGGTLLWSEEQIVTVSKGNFSVVLGQGIQVEGEPRGALEGVFSGDSASDRYLETTVTVGAATTTILPRLRLLPGPYAFLARNALNLVQPDGTSVVNYSLGRLNVASTLAVAGDVNASRFNGSGAGLTSLNANALTGTLDDSRLSLNVARRNTGNTFVGDQILVGNGNVQGHWRVGLHVQSPISQPAGYGNAVVFSGGPDVSAFWNNDNSDPLWIARYNVSDNTTELRVNIGDDPGQLSDRLVIGATQGGGPDFTFSGTWVPRFAFTANGHLGINTTSPEVPLHVMGNVVLTRTFAYFARRSTDGAAISGSVASGSADYSILAQNRVGASEFNAFSDARIKEVVGHSDAGQDLARLRELKVINYRPVDKVSEGDAVRKGFIAQEVETLLPEAVTRTTQFVPDIYAEGQVTDFNEAEQRLALEMDKPHGLRPGDRVRLITEQRPLELAVSSVPSDRQFVVTGCAERPGRVFVYGKQVSDFRSLNYDHIFTLAVSALQAVAGRVEELESRCARLAELEQKAARVESLEREVAELKRLVARLTSDERVAQTSGGADQEASRFVAVRAPAKAKRRTADVSE